MAVKRMRVFAGPNGSGKTTTFKELLAELKVGLGVYVNADDIEKDLKNSRTYDFSPFKLNISDRDVKNFFRQSNFSPIKRNEPDLWSKLRVDKNTLEVHTTIDSYLAADLAECIRQQLMANGISFTYETVMSHAGKIDFFQKAIEKGYKVYLYFISTNSPEINISRVNIRVAQAGHAVNPEVIRTRYYRSLDNLYAAVKQTNRAFIFDNSKKQARLIAEITNGKELALHSVDDVPNWAKEYLLNKDF